MRIHFKGTNYELSPQMTRFAEKKIKTLKKHAGNQDSVAQAFINLTKLGTQNTGKVWRAELNLDINGKRYNATETADTLESAIEAVASEVGRELESTRKRERDLVRRGGSVIKSLMRGFQT